MFDVYQPSGRVGALAIPLVLAGLAVACGLAFVYQWLLHWIPFIYINFFITVGMGIGVAIIASSVIRWGRVRNTLIGSLIGIVIATGGLVGAFWFQYQRDLNEATTAAMSDMQLPESKWAETKSQIAQQFTWGQHIQMRAGDGWALGRGGKGLPIKGIFVYLIWLIEAVIVTFITYSATSDAATAPYSEQSDKWADEATVVMTLPVTDDAMVTQIRSAATLDQLLSIPVPKTDQSQRFAVYTVNSIPGEELEDAYVSVKLVTHSVNSKGEAQTSEEPLVKFATLPTAKRKQLIENAELLQEALNDYRASMSSTTS